MTTIGIKQHNPTIIQQNCLNKQLNIKKKISKEDKQNYTNIILLELIEKLSKIDDKQELEELEEQINNYYKKIQKCLNTNIKANKLNYFNNTEYLYDIAKHKYNLIPKIFYILCKFFLHYDCIKYTDSMQDLKIKTKTLFDLKLQRSDKKDQACQTKLIKTLIPLFFDSKYQKDHLNYAIEIALNFNLINFRIGKIQVNCDKKNNKIEFHFFDKKKSYHANNTCGAKKFIKIANYYWTIDIANLKDEKEKMINLFNNNFSEFIKKYELKQYVTLSKNSPIYRNENIESKLSADNFKKFIKIDKRNDIQKDIFKQEYLGKILLDNLKALTQKQRKNIAEQLIKKAEDIITKTSKFPTDLKPNNILINNNDIINIIDYTSLVFTPLYCLIQQINDFSDSKFSHEELFYSNLIFTLYRVFTEGIFSNIIETEIKVKSENKKFYFFTANKNSNNIHIIEWFNFINKFIDENKCADINKDRFKLIFILACKQMQFEFIHYKIGNSTITYDMDDEDIVKKVLKDNIELNTIIKKDKNSIFYNCKKLTYTNPE